jgi:hypothetical protein
LVVAAFQAWAKALLAEKLEEVWDFQDPLMKMQAVAEKLNFLHLPVLMMHLAWAMRLLPRQLAL